MADCASYARCISVLFSALILRYLLFLSGVKNWVFNSVEFVTPATSWKRVLEGLSLLDYGISPYSGDTVHEPPLVLLLFHKLKCGHCEISIQVFFIICDLVTGLVLYKCAKLHCESEISNEKRNLCHYAEKVESILLNSDRLKNVPFYVMTSYLLNPFTVGTCVAQSTGIFTNFSVSLALYYSCLGSTSLSTFFLAFATYKSLYPAMLIVPVCLILVQKNSQCDGKNGENRTSLYISLTTFWFAFWMAVFIGLSYALIGSWEFLDATYGFIIRVPDLTPNMGLFWYLFLEMFDHFREFFILVFQLNSFFYIIPLATLLRKDPVFLFYTITSVMAVFKSYPAFGDFAIPFALVISWSHLYPYMKNVFIVACILIFSSFLAPLFWYLWIYAGSANANFFYAATLAYSTSQIFLLSDVIVAFHRRKFDLKHGITRNTVDGEKMIVILK